MRAVPTSYVPEGAVLAEDLFTASGKILLRAGRTLTTNLISKINENNIFTVYINDIHSDHEVNRVVEQSLRVKGIQLIKELFTAAAEDEEILSLHNELSQFADDVLYEMSAVKENQIEYTDIKNVDDYIYSSALNVAIIATLIAWDLSYNREMIKQIFLGGIYHDIGIAFLEPDVVQKNKELTLEEKKMILMHPHSGHRFVKEKAFISAYVKAMTLQHHERIDGNGYPNRVKGDQINMVAQIVGIADVYDAMTSDRPYRRAVAPQEAIEYIMGTAGTHFDMKIATTFINKVNPYPKGSIVELNDGRKAVVDFVPKQLPLRPKIRIITKNGDGFEYEEVDLQVNTTLIIEKMCYDVD